MALDKQRILSELGSVVNQLQSAECGCMGKLFSDPGQGASMGFGGCRAGGCCHGHGSPHAGEPYPAMNNQCHMKRPCMGQCNPPKLYADTYSYLNKNLMQPIVNEVYNDLKSISPANTIMNNPMATKMGLSPTNQAGQNNMGDMSSGNPYQAGDMSGMSPGYDLSMNNPNSSQPVSHEMGQMNQHTGHMNHRMGQMGQPMTHMDQSMRMNQPVDQMGGMGSQIVNMMMGDKSSKPVNNNIPMQNSQLNDSMLIDAPQSPHGQVGITPLHVGTYGQGASGAMQNASYVQDNTGAYTQNPTTQYMSQPNAFGNVTNNMPQYNMKANSGSMVQNGQSSQPMATTSYGQHTQGVKKFSEMFPGVMQGDLGFDPMAIAIQMNPANQQKAAMSSMQQLMNGNKIIDPNSSVMKSIQNASNAVHPNMVQQGAPISQNNQQVVQSLQQQESMQQQPMQQQPIQQQPMQQEMQPQAMQQQAMQQQVMQQQPMQQQPIQQQPMQQQPMQQQPMQQQPMQQQPMQQQPIQQAMQQQPMQQQPEQQQRMQKTGVPSHQIPQQQVYTATTNSMQYQHAPTNSNYQYQQQQYQNGQQIIDPTTGTIIPEAEDSLVSKQMIMEPIFPADTSRNRALTYSHNIKHPRNYHYNTLGQPVTWLDAKAYRPPEPALPQTLSPQPTAFKPKPNPPTFSNVKNTVSKTSIMGQGKLGKAPSKSQLQHLYNQYKGSHSFTQQNVNAPIHTHTHSEGKLNEPMNIPQPRNVPMEKVAGDTIANVNNVNNEMVNKLENFAAPMGDIAAINKPQGDGVMPKESPMITSKGRNGLQDIVYTSGPTSAAWSFHGHNHLPFSTGYRFRTKVR